MTTSPKHNNASTFAYIVLMTAIWFAIFSMLFGCKKDETITAPKNCACGEVFFKDWQPGSWRVHAKNHCSGDTLVWNVGQSNYPNYSVGSEFCDEGGNSW